MNKDEFHSLCQQLAALESRLTVYNEPERGDKASLKRIRETLRDAVGQRNLEKLTKKANCMNRAWFVEQRTNFDTEEAERAAKEDRKDAQTEYRKFCDDLYKATYPAPPPPQAVLPPEVIERLQALTEQIQEAKHKYELAQQREKQAWEDMKQIQTDTQDARDVVLALQDKAEMVRKGEL